ncbi:hypothetical protein CJ030_MR6G011284 [Morella rubra]|uniref:Sialate O-acetylesterase domain-containing protein n=1 Tax=Morella rubra TaxID=262757 RepID=A0A6A1VAF7_9ROSI|nr:hypothetical protein CJ030_MR6G011284 [Morella rubra]
MDMALTLFFLFLLAQAWSVRPHQPKNIFILAGQSNMAGRGGVVNDTITGIVTWDGIVPPQCQPNPFILRLSANLTWVLAHEPLHADIDANKTMELDRAWLLLTPFGQRQTFGVIGLVALASGRSVAFIDTVREAQLGIDLLNLRTVDAKGLPLQPDTLHLSTPAQVRLGEKLAETYLQFLPSGPISSPTPPLVWCRKLL